MTKRGFAGVVGPLRQGQVQEPAEADLDADLVSWWTQLCEADEDADIKGSCDAAGLHRAVTNSAIAFENGLVSGLALRPPKPGGRPPTTGSPRQAASVAGQTLTTDYNLRTLLVRGALLQGSPRVIAAPTADDSPKQPIDKWQYSDWTEIRHSGAEKVRDNLRRPEPLSQAGRQYRQEQLAVLGRPSERHRASFDWLKRMAQLRPIARPLAQMLLAGIGLPVDFGFDAAGAPDQVGVALTKNLVGAVPNAVAAYRQGANSELSSRFDETPTDLEARVATHVRRHPVLPYSDRKSFLELGDEVSARFGAGQILTALEALAADRPTSNPAYDAEFPTAKRFAPTSELSYSFPRLHGHSGVGGVLIGRPPDAGRLNGRDLTWTTDLKGQVTVDVVLADTVVQVGPAQSETVAAALAYAADGRPTAATILNVIPTAAQRVLLHPALVNTPVGCRVVELDRLLYRWLAADSGLEQLYQQEVGNAHRVLKKIGKSGNPVSGVREAPYVLESFNEVSFDYHFLMNIDMTDRQKPWDYRLIEDQVAALVQKGFREDARARALRAHVKMFVRLQRVFRLALEGRLGGSFPVERLAVLSDFVTHRAQATVTTPRWFVPDRTKALTRRRNSFLLSTLPPRTTHPLMFTMDSELRNFRNDVQQCRKAVVALGDSWAQTARGSDHCQSLCRRHPLRASTDRFADYEGRASANELHRSLCQDLEWAAELATAPSGTEPIPCTLHNPDG